MSISFLALRRRGRRLRFYHSMTLRSCCAPKLFAILTASLVLAAAVTAWFAMRGESVSKAKLTPVANLQQTKAKAESGDAEAQKNLGVLSAHGEGVSHSYDEAAKWYRRAAYLGNAAAQNALCELYEAGRGVPHDDTEASNWYRRAAELG